MIKINRTKILFLTGAALKAVLGVILCLQNLYAGVLILLEMLLLAGALCIMPRRWRALLLPLAVLNILQALHITGGGNFLLTETLMNLTATNVVSLELKLRMSLMLAGLAAAWLPDFLLKKRYTCPLKYAAAGGVLFLLAEIFIPLPVVRTFSPAYEAVQLYSIDKPMLVKGRKFYRSQIEDSGISRKLDSEKKNIILIFTEGTSINCLSKELTPNLWDLGQKSLSFKNYYNHTAATFRGIRGQLGSSYPAMGGVAIPGYSGFQTMTPTQIEEFYPAELPTVPRILAKYGYRSKFFSPHFSKEQLGMVMKIVGFQEISYADNYEPGRIWISDRQLYELLWKEMEQLEKSSQPFFIAVYPSGTHHGFDSPDIRYKDGKNPYLNKFYQHDFWFGKFMEKFRNSKLSDDTIVIVTSDHAIYPTPEAKALFKLETSTFVDRIPLMIYNRNFKPMLIDAGNRNSLSLAPTILDLLGIHKEGSYFLGNSLFGTKKSKYDFIAIEGKMIFQVREDGKAGLLKDISRENHKKWSEWLEDYYSCFW